MTLDAENWDLTIDEHLARAHELLDVPPRSGDIVHHYLTGVAIGGRHAGLALLKMAEAAKEEAA